MRFQTDIYGELHTLDDRKRIEGLIMAAHSKNRATIAIKNNGCTKNGTVPAKKNPVSIVSTKPIAIPIRITVRKLFPIRSAIEAGKTMMVDTKRAPAAGIIKAMATPVTILKAMDIARTGRPSTKAVSSSKVRIYMGLRNKTVKIRITAAITKRLRTCS